MFFFIIPSGESYCNDRSKEFSKSGNLEIEKWYATHFVNTKRIAVLKAQQPVENLA